MSLAAKTQPLDDLIARGFDVLFVSHAKSILETEFAPELAEVAALLAGMSLPVSEIIGSGGGETQFTQRTRRALTELGWKKHNFVIKKTIDGKDRESTSHEVDHVKVAPAGTLGLEIEWNNKDPFFDRDLENFKRLHAEGAISVGIVLTRGSSLQAGLHAMVERFAADRGIDSFDALKRHGVKPTDKQQANIRHRVDRAAHPMPFAQAWVDNFMSNKFGAATTHWDKLMARVDRGVGNPCPLLLIGLPASIVINDSGPVVPLDEDGSGAQA